MDRPCDGFEEFRRKRDRGCTGSEQREFDEHLAQCPRCADQYIADEAILDLFSKIPLPELSAMFNENLRHHVLKERIEPSRRPLFMKVYWLIACILSVVVLSLIKVNISDGLNALVFILFCFAVPMLVLGRSLRFNLFDLIPTTMNRSEKRVST